ncbi:gas vesicle protein [Rhodobacterales bacterium HKCCE3408]|nr:gas vesicle protein [Rhodobacterales bacterium HKCCE3408]
MAEPTFDLQFASSEDVLTGQDNRLVDVVDSLLDHGVVLRGEIWLTVADIDLVFLGLDLVLASPDRMAADRGAG